MVSAAGSEDLRSFYDPELKLGACGDWVAGPRVSDAYQSGLDLGGSILAHIAGESK